MFQLPTALLAGLNSLRGKKLKAAWTSEEVQEAFSEAGWDGPVVDIKPGVYKLGPMSTAQAHRLHKQLSEHPALLVEVQEAFVPTAEDLAHVQVTLKEGLQAGTPDPTAKPIRRGGLRKFRDKPVDHQEMGSEPDPTLMVRTPGVGTVTFDTTMGETMVSSMQDEVPAGDPNRKFEVWWVKEDRDGEPRTYYADVAFMTEASAQAYAKRKGLDRKYEDWGIRDKEAEYAELRQAREARKARQSEEIEKAKALLKKHGVKGSALEDAVDDLTQGEKKAWLRKKGLWLDVTHPVKEPDFDKLFEKHKYTWAEEQGIEASAGYETGDTVVFLNGQGQEETGTIDSCEDDGYVINEKLVNKQRVLRRG